MIAKRTLAMLKPDGKKVPVPDAIVTKYGLQPGSRAPFSGLPIVELGRELTREEALLAEHAARMQLLAVTLREQAAAAAARASAEAAPARARRRKGAAKTALARKKRPVAKKRAASTAGRIKRSAARRPAAARPKEKRMPVA